jgi:signal transduction histidine kinase
LRDLFEGVRATASPARAVAEDLADMVGRFGVYSGLDMRCTAEGTPLVVPPRARREVLRIVHEALVNARKHSGATRVTVRSRVADDTLIVQVEDNGRGFPFAGTRHADELRANGTGPFTVLERARLINGDITITSTPGTSACLELSVPVAVEEGATWEIG